MKKLVLVLTILLVTPAHADTVTIGDIVYRIDNATVVGDGITYPILQYRAFVDPSGGSADAMTLAIAHQEKKGQATTIVLDCVRERRSPFSPDDVVRDFAETLSEGPLAQLTVPLW